MRNLEEYGCECIKELANFQIDLSNMPTIIWKISNSKKTFGYCSYYRETAVISIAGFLLDENILKNDIYLKNVIIHELLHALTPGAHHGGAWKQLAQSVNERSKGKYHISRLADYKEYGVSDYITSVMKYKIICQRCGKISYRNKKTKVIKNIENFKCVCGGELKIEQTY